MRRKTTAGTIDPDITWNDLKETIYKAAKDTLRIKKQAHHDWFDENDVMMSEPNSCWMIFTDIIWNRQA